MDTDVLVDSRIEDGQRIIAEMAREGYPASVAFWLKASDDGLWRLYIASPKIETGKVGDAYISLYDAMDRVQTSLLTLSDVKLLPASKAIALEAAAIRDREPKRRLPTRFHGKSLANVSIEEAYIYPPLIPNGGGKAGAGPGRRVTRIVGMRNEGGGSDAKVVEDEIGVVVGTPDDNDFPQKYLDLIVARFGDPDAFAKQYPQGARVEWPRKGRWETGRFKARGDDGREVEIVEHTTFIEAPTMQGPLALTGLKDLTTTEGQHVNFRSNGVYEIVETGEVVHGG